MCRGIGGIAIALILWTGQIALCQRITGDILGTVYDSNGAAVPGATITLNSLDTGRKISTKSSALDGSYLFTQLPPGRYELQAEQPGFKTQVITDIRISMEQRARVDFALQVGEVTTRVEVRGGEVLLQTESSELAQLVDNRKIRELPLNGRNYIQLGAITAGVIGGSDLISNTTNWTGRSNVSLWVAGQREIQTSYLVDGIETRNDRFGSAGFRPSVDVIEEFRLDRNAFGVEFGNDSAAVVNVSTKAGTNDFHGTAYEFMRNNRLDARNFFDVGKRPPLRLNDFGGAVGGPILKNKLFFFGSYEGLRTRRGGTYRSLLPSKAQLGGNLADDSAGTGIFPTSSGFCQDNPRSPKCRDVIDPDSGLPFPGNIIPSNRISRYASVYAPFFAEANNLSLLPQFNRAESLSGTNDFDQFSARVDHTLSSKDNVFYRYLWVDESQLSPAAVFLGGLSRPQSGQNLALGWTHVFTPRLVNSFHGGYNRSINSYLPEGAGGKDYAKEVFGMRNTSANPFDFGMPRTVIQGFLTMGSAPLVIASNQQLFQFTNTLSYTRDKHTLRFGGEVRRLRYFQITDSPGKPGLSFDGIFTRSGLGDFLLGIPVSAQQSLGDTSQNIRVSYFSAYASDAYKLTSRLTLNFGLRWEYKTPPTEINDRQAIFDFTQRRTLLAGKDLPRHIFDKDHRNFGPHVGFAYMPFRKTVIRGGLGVYWSQQEANDYQFLVLTPPFNRALNLISSGTAPTLFADQLFPAVEIGGPEANASIFTRFLGERRPYTPQWNFGIQHQFGNDWSLEIAYMGNATVRNGTYAQMNAGREDPTGTIPIAQRRPYPELTGLLLATTNGHGHYTGGTASLNKRFSNGLTLLANYTLAKAIDDASNEINQTYRPLEGRKDMRGASDFDIRQRFVLSYVYELPAGKGRRFVNQGGIAGAMLGGWQVSGVTTFMTGPPATVITPGDWALTGVRSRADCVSNPNNSSIAGQVRNNGLMYFDPEGFQMPAPFTMGNCGRNTLRSPGINNWDLGVHKSFSITERVALQTRFEFFNAWNHAQWMPFAGGTAVGYGKPGYGNQSFGKVTSAREGRDIQISMKLLF